MSLYDRVVEPEIAEAVGHLARQMKSPTYSIEGPKGHEWRQRSHQFLHKMSASVERRRRWLAQQRHGKPRQTVGKQIKSEKRYMERLIKHATPKRPGSAGH